ncbi:MAG: hypothetical protein ACYSSI_13245 [Planctomycetota bacterium]|jgi:hypothetical protein
MKRLIVMLVLGIILSGSALFVGGCSCMPSLAERSCAQPGETVAEGNRRHIRNARIERQNMMKDIDIFMLSDRPSRLTEMRLP